MSLYSYGGFVLEQLPELDATFSKYTAIAYVEYGSDGSDTAGRSITLYASNEMLSVDANRNLIVPAGAMFQRYRLNLSGNTMGWELTESSTGTGNYASTSPIWANHNILNPDNVITVVGSDPVLFSEVSTDKAWVNAGGIKLPEFPASDEPLTRYDYIFKSPSFGGYLYFRSKSPAYMDSEISETLWFNEGDFQVSKYLTRYNKPYWDSFVNPWPLSPAYINKADLVWHGEIYDRTTETTLSQSPDPTPWTLFDLKTFCIFLAAGLCMPPIPRGKLPTAYNYNGVILPALPEWDKETYPHAVIVRSNETDTNYRLYLDTQFEATSDGRVNRLFPKDQDFSYRNGVWDESSSGGLYHYVLWTNKDLYYTTDAGGGLFMAGSEPVPVYE